MTNRDQMNCPHCGGDLTGMMAELRKRTHVELSRKIKRGIASARSQGKRWGLQPKLEGKARAQLLRAVDDHPDRSLREIALEHGISRVTLWRYMREAGYGG